MEESSEPVRYERPLRPNRGKNPNARWVIDDVQPKAPTKRRKPSGGGAPKKTKPEEEEILEGEVDCRCNGEVSDENTMAECEKCKTWQHIVCEFGVNDESALPKPHYECHKCREKEDSDSGAPEVLPLQPKRERAEVLKLPDYEDDVRKSVAGVFRTIILERADTDDIDPPSEDVAEKLAIEVECALYDQFSENKDDLSSDVGGPYREQYRTLSFNLKDVKNRWLRKELLSAKITPKQFAKMSSEELRNPKLQQIVEDAQDENLRDTILKEEDLPHPPLETINTATAEVDAEPTPLALKQEDKANEKELDEAMKEPLGPPPSGVPNPSKLEDPVWQGELKLADNTISLKAKGFRLTGHRKWPADSLVMSGMVQAERGFAYLSTLAEQPDTYAVASLALVGENTEALSELYDYMHARDRLGSLQTKDSTVKVAYLIPYTSKASLEFLGLFEDQLEFLKHLETEHDAHKVILAVNVLNKTD